MAAVGVPISFGSTIANIPFTGSLQNTSRTPIPMSNTWATSTVKNLVFGDTFGTDMSFGKLDIQFTEKMDFAERVDEIIDLYKATETLTHKVMDPVIQTTFCDILVFDIEMNRYKLMDVFYQKLSKLNKIKYYVKYNKIIDHIIAITNMMKKQDSLIEEFYTMSTTYLAHGKTTPLKMLEDTLCDLVRMKSVTDTRILVSKIHFLATNIDRNLKIFNRIVNATPIEVIELVNEVFSS